MAVKYSFYIFAKAKERVRREPGCSLLLLSGIMSREDQIETVQKLLQPLLVDDIFLVDIKIKPTNNIKIYLDADSGLGIEKCIKINRRLYKVMEEMGLYPDGDFSLEVSSPGVDEPLKIHRQFLKNIGRNVVVKLNDDSIKEGKLISATETDLTIEYTEGKNKKAVTHTVTIPFTDIKQTTVQVKF